MRNSTLVAVGIIALTAILLSCLLSAHRTNEHRIDACRSINNEVTRTLCINGRDRP